MLTLKALALFLVLILVLWVANRIGQVVLRMLMGLLLMALVGLIIWYLFIR